MKKKIVALLMAACMMASTIGASAIGVVEGENDMMTSMNYVWNTSEGSYLFFEGNYRTMVMNDNTGKEDISGEVVRTVFGQGIAPGNIWHAGDHVDWSYLNARYENRDTYSAFAEDSVIGFNGMVTNVVFLKNPIEIQLPTDTCLYDWDNPVHRQALAELYTNMSAVFANDEYYAIYATGDTFGLLDGVVPARMITGPQVMQEIPEFDGNKAWRVVLAFNGYVFVVPHYGYTLVESGNVTEWIDPYGNVLWHVVENEDSFDGGLTDWGSIPAKFIDKWKASGKKVNIEYQYNGYTVSIAIPAGELTDTGAEWYGPEYLAAVNQKYVVVKDSTGLVVPNDRIYKK